MADTKNGLPIRSEVDGADSRVQVKVVDPSLPGTQQMTVDADNNAHVEIHGNDPSSVDRVVRLSEQGALTPDGVYDGSNNTVPGNLATILHLRNTTPGLAQQAFRPTGIQGTANDQVHAADIALHDENGNPFTSNNPLPVAISESEGDEIIDYKTTANVVSAGVANHDYVVTVGKEFVGSMIWVSGSVELKVEVQVETGIGTGVYTTKFVAFNSVANTNVRIPLEKIVTVQAQITIRIKITNLDNKTQDVYSTLVGIEK